ncbi:larval cuticle protein 2-like [Calliphora vicina]|uniref:larval cuticle protein 2-like n=1 Tax=Calliphora vicina TaxID=7373 RepID=UPI00325A7415
MIKFVIVLAFVAVSSSKHHSSGVSHASVDDGNAEIIFLDIDVRPNGFHYGLETTSPFRAVASGDDHGNIHGDFEWISPEGEHVAVKYVADEYGYQPSGNALPTSPPVPAAILKSLEYIRNHPHHDQH